MYELDFDTSCEQLAAKLKADWAAVNDKPMIFQNSKEAKIVPDGAFIEIEFQAYDQDLATILGSRGGNLYETTGAVVGTCFVPAFSGLALARRMRQDFSGILRGLSFLGFRFYGVTPIGGGASADQGTKFSLAAVANFSFRSLG